MRVYGIVILILLCGSLVLARPAYQEGQYYVFKNRTTAVKAIGFIGVNAWSPLGSSDVEIYEKLRESLVQLKDGRWALPRIAETILDAKAVSESQRELFWNKFGVAALVVTQDMIQINE